MFSVIIDTDKARTQGDGMEQEDLSPPKVEQNSTLVSEENLRKNAPNARTSIRNKDSLAMQEKLYSEKPSSSTNSLPLPGLHTLYRRPGTVIRSLAPAKPKGELVQLKPRLVTSTAILPEHKKTKPPKFVPFEPYPGAVNPIVPNAKNDSVKLTPQKVNKNNLDIGVLASQMSSLRSQEMDDVKGNCETGPSGTDEELRKLKEELKTTKEERDYFHGQFKFQTQVNSELKNLLVASVGEDLQTHVNVLTEDKLQLARALLDSANNLTTHTEQIDFLASQCEVWRSKFLASSVMVEELARWKADLTQKSQMLTESTKRLLQTTHQIRDMQLEILKNLKFIAKIRYLNLPEVDVVSLSAENLNILQQMVLHSGVGVPDGNLNISSASKNPLCEAEKYATEALQFVSQPLMATDEAIRALFGQANRPYTKPSEVQQQGQELN